MNKEAQRIAIAEACGFETKFDGVRLWRGWGRNGGSWFGFVALPDFLSDLDAMHEAEQALPKNDWDENGVCSEGRYRMHLGLLCGEKLWHASAKQRAKAFLLTTGRWVETEEAPSVLVPSKVR